MSQKRTAIVSILLLCDLFLFALFIGGIYTPAFAQKKEVVAYYPEWGVNRQKYYLKNIETTGSAKFVTVLIYSFSEPVPDASGAIVPKFMSRYLDYEQVYPAQLSVDGIADDSTQALRGEFNQLKKLKAKHPDMKIMLSVGGWTGSRYYSDLCATPEAREKFINECIDIFIRGNLPVENGAGGKGVAKGIFDGFDIDWEFPVDGGDDGIHHLPNDKENLTAFLALFRAKLNQIDPNLLLTMAVAARTSDLWKYNFVKDQEYLDWYNLMTYDFHGVWDSKTGHHTNLFSPDSNRMSPGECSLDKTVRYLRDSLHILAKKLMPGAAFYGKGWAHVNPTNYGLNQAGGAADGRFEPSSNNYCDLLPLIKSGAEYHHDDLAMAPWLYVPRDSSFWTYDDERSIALKTQYCRVYNLRGIMTWDISGDDSAGTLIKIMATGKVPDIKEKAIGKAKKDSRFALIQPKAGQVIAAGSDLVLKADIGNIKFKKVEFFGDNKSLGYTTQMPAVWVWFNVPAGEHKVTVVGIDDQGKKIIPKQSAMIIRVSK